MPPKGSLFRVTVDLVMAAHMAGDAGVRGGRVMVMTDSKKAGARVAKESVNRPPLDDDLIATSRRDGSLESTLTNEV